MRLAVGRIRAAEARAMAEHLRERHPELHLGATAGLGDGGSDHPNDQMIDHEPPRTARTKKPLSL